jgi:hypothetical protein
MGQKNSYMEFMNPIFLKIKQNGKNIYDVLTKPKVVKISIYISLITFLNHKLDNSRREHYTILFRRIFGYIGVVSLFIGVIGMFFVGVFSLDRSPFFLHQYFAVSAFGGFAVGAFFTGLAIVLRKRIFPKAVGYFMIFGPSTASIVFLICPAPLTQQFLEWVLMFSSLAWYYVIVFITLQKLNTLLFFNPDFKW